MPVSRHVAGQLVYPLRKQCHLNLSGTGVTLINLKLTYDFFLFHFVQS
jgi:hypothetical protein